MYLVMMKKRAAEKNETYKESEADWSATWLSKQWTNK